MVGQPPQWTSNESFREWVLGTSFNFYRHKTIPFRNGWACKQSCCRVPDTKQEVQNLLRSARPGKKQPQVKPFPALLLLVFFSITRFIDSLFRFLPYLCWKTSVPASLRPCFCYRRRSDFEPSNCGLLHIWGIQNTVATSRWLEVDLPVAMMSAKMAGLTWTNVNLQVSGLNDTLQVYHLLRGLKQSVSIARWSLTIFGLKDHLLGILYLKRDQLLGLQR